jgi:hypothetical protein
MIILVSPSGNHSNRLFQTIHFEAFAKEFKLNYINISFNDIAHIFDGRFTLFEKYGSKLLKILIRLFNIKAFDFNEAFIEQCAGNYQFLKKNVVFVEGWGFRCDELTNKYRYYFQCKYSFSKTLLTDYIYHTNKNIGLILDCFRESDVKIGVHIRRGDYLEWMDGIHYYDNEVYIRAIQRMRGFFSQLRIKFIVFSSESLNIDLSDDVIISDNDWYIDHYLMSCCDYLLGPPSTFTMWASYISTADTKYYHIKDRNDLPESISDFVTCNG